MSDKRSLDYVDPEVFAAMAKEQIRLEDGIELIASENVVSQAVLEAMGSVLTNKYAEGYPGRRYYGGCEYVDQVETLAILRAKKLFGAEHVNVQPHSGAQANQAVYLAVLDPGDRILGMDLSHGGHLTHGSKVSASGKLYDAHYYPVTREEQIIDYDQVLCRAKEVKPKLIIAGASAYARIIDFKKFREIADEVGAYLMVDMAHIAGLVAANLHPSPIPHAHFVTTTTHKTLRGPRGGMILTTDEYARKINSAVFPGLQGGPLMHVIAAKAVMLKEALSDEFKLYQKQVIINAKTLADCLLNLGYKLVSGTTENHLVLLDLRNKDMTGKYAEETLEKVGITVNKNMIPYDPEKPMIASGMRLGTPAVTSRGFMAGEMETLAVLMDKILVDPEAGNDVRTGVGELCRRFPNLKR